MPRIITSLGVLAMSALLGGTALATSPQPDSTAVTMNQSLEASLRDAQLKRTAHDYAGAVKVLSQLMLVAADDPRVVGEYGKVLVQQGRSREALDFLNRAVQLQQNDWTLYSALGVAYDQTADFVSARAAYDRALALNPSDTVVLNNYAMSRALAGDLPEAKRLIAEAASGTKDERITRNVRLINGLTPKVAQQNTHQTQVARIPTGLAPVQTRSLSAPPPKAASGIPHPLTTPRTITAQEGRSIVMQAVPADPLAGPVAAKKTVRKVASNSATPAKKPAPKADKSGIPDLRLANDRQ